MNTFNLSECGMFLGKFDHASKSAFVNSDINAEPEGLTYCFSLIQPKPEVATLNWTLESVKFFTKPAIPGNMAAPECLKNKHEVLNSVGSYSIESWPLLHTMSLSIFQLCSLSLHGPPLCATLLLFCSTTVSWLWDIQLWKDSYRSIYCTGGILLNYHTEIHSAAESMHSFYICIGSLCGYVLDFIDLWPCTRLEVLITQVP